MHRSASNIHEICLKHNIELFIVGIPRIINETADFISKFYDKDGHSCTTDFFFFFLAQSEFNIMCKFYRYALNIHTKCLRFDCLTDCIGTYAVECFNYHWGSPSMNWLLTPHQD